MGVKNRNVTAADVIRTSFSKMGVTLKGDKTDIGGVGINNANAVKVGDNTMKYYPWGKNNRLPFEILTLVRSNADMLNLLDTKIDFLCGGGVGVYKDVDGVPTEVKAWNVREWILEKELSELMEGYYSDMVHLANAFIDVDRNIKSEWPTLRHIDPTTMRVGIPADKGRVTDYLMSYAWDSAGKKEATSYKAWMPGIKAKSSIIHHKPVQAGQFWYGHANWTALKPIIELANKIPNFHNNGLDTEGVIGHIWHISKNYFTELQAEFKKEDGTDYSIDELEEAFKTEADDFLFGEGKNKMLIDVCAYDPVKNTMSKYIEIEAVPRNMKGDEYMKLAVYVVNTMSSGSGILNGLSGVSDGKMNSGGGTEIRISAEYQQFYRTYRSREPFLNMLNKIYLPELRGLGLIAAEDDVYFAHRNILLQTLDVNKSGVKEVVDASINDNVTKTE